MLWTGHQPQVVFTSLYLEHRGHLVSSERCWGYWKCRSEVQCVNKVSLSLYWLMVDGVKKVFLRRQHGRREWGGKNVGELSHLKSHLKSHLSALYFDKIHMSRWSRQSGPDVFGRGPGEWTEPWSEQHWALPGAPAPEQLCHLAD